MKTFDIQSLRERIAKGNATVRALCAGEQRWVMHVPARPDEDPDLLLSDALRAGEEAIAALEAVDADGRWMAALNRLDVDFPERLFRIEGRLREILGDAHHLRRSCSPAGDPVWTVGTRSLDVGNVYDRTGSEAELEAFCRSLKASCDKDLARRLEISAQVRPNSTQLFGNGSGRKPG